MAGAKARNFVRRRSTELPPAFLTLHIGGEGEPAQLVEGPPSRPRAGTRLTENETARSDARVFLFTSAAVFGRNRQRQKVMMGIARWPRRSAQIVSQNLRVVATLGSR